MATISSDPGVPEDFKHFPSFPLEVRRKIWRAAFPDSRIINLSYNSCPAKCSLTPPPVTLHICHESRAETLRHYSLIYRNDWKGRTPNNSSIYQKQPICFDPEIDIAHFNADEFIEPERQRRCFNEWVLYLDSREPRLLKRTTSVELDGLDWQNTLYLLLKYQEMLKCKRAGLEYAGHGGAEKWEELNYGTLLKFVNLDEIRCVYMHMEYLGNFEDQLRKFLGFHKHVWGEKGVPKIGRPGMI